MVKLRICYHINMHYLSCILIVYLLFLYIRVADDLPLYDILNEFQKGHSHMAVVVKRTKEVGASPEKNNGATSDYKINHKHVYADGTSFTHPFCVYAP